MNQRFENSIFVGVLGLEIKACVLSKSQSEAFWSNAGFAAPALLLVLAGFSLAWNLCVSFDTRCHVPGFSCRSFPHELVSRNRELYARNLTSPFIMQLLCAAKVAWPAAASVQAFPPTLVPGEGFWQCQAHRRGSAWPVLDHGWCESPARNLYRYLTETQLLSKRFRSFRAWGEQTHGGVGLSMFSYLMILMVWPSPNCKEPFPLPFDCVRL